MNDVYFDQINHSFLCYVITWTCINYGILLCVAAILVCSLDYWRGSCDDGKGK